MRRKIKIKVNFKRNGTTLRVARGTRGRLDPKDLAGEVEHEVVVLLHAVLDVVAVTLRAIIRPQYRY